jgi:molecular chaperone GrpE
VSDPEAVMGASNGAEEEAPVEAEGALAPPAEVEPEVDELTATAVQRDEYLALAQRTQADFENYRKRAAREAAAAQERGLAKLARELLPALDNLDRALAHADETAADETLLDGLRLVRRELLGALERVGISAYGEAGERFDPEIHEAVAQQPADGVQAGDIVEVYQAGYRSESGGVIRPARVLVAG